LQIRGIPLNPGYDGTEGKKVETCKKMQSKKQWGEDITEMALGGLSRR
jgi:hypothetical protein